MTTESDFVKSSPLRLSFDEIPAHVKKQAATKLVGNAEFHPAKEGGSYKGAVIFCDSDFLVQDVNNERRTAIVHRRSDLDFADNNLKRRVERSNLDGALIQVYYQAKDATPTQAAKVYNWNPGRELHREFQRIYREIRSAKGKDSNAKNDIAKK